jgi:hypothetical protein
VTTFQFRLTHSSTPYADGIWFGIQNSGILPNSGSDNTFAVEFDTFQNTWDPNGNHVAFMSCGPDNPDTTVNNACQIAINPNLPILLADGQIHTASLDYVPGSMTLSLDGSIVLSAPIDLSTELNLDGTNAWVGFYTSTGAYSENNDILSWQFSPTPEPSSITLVAAVSAGSHPARPNTATAAKGIDNAQLDYLKSSSPAAMRWNVPSKPSSLMSLAVILLLTLCSPWA